jgi:AraC family transcriptional regulator
MRDGPPLRSHGYVADGVVHPVVQISPPDTCRRHVAKGTGWTAESIQCTRQKKIQLRFRARVHLLVAYENGIRRDGETFVEGLPRSTLRNFERKLTFVPAGHEYHESHGSISQTRLLHFYFDPAKLRSEPECPGLSLTPRLFFEDITLWQTAIKLRTLLETPAPQDQLYLEMLGTLLAHEVSRLDRGLPSIQPQIRGGLATWQQRAVAAYIEEHAAETISLVSLAQLARLSRYHFCRAFKQSFGTTPHRYQANCRIEHAKLLLARPAMSVTDVGLTVGFCSSNSFATAFRQATGLTPTEYRRSVDAGYDTLNGAAARDSDVRENLASRLQQA